MTNIINVDIQFIVSRTSEETPVNVLERKRTSDADVPAAKRPTIIDLTRTYSNENAAGEPDAREVKATKRQRDGSPECIVSHKKKIVQEATHIPDIVIKSKSAGFTIAKRRSATLHKRRKRKARKTDRDHGKEYLEEHYEVGKELGSGAFGVVSSAVRKRDNLPVALKSVPKKKIRDWEHIDGSRLPMEICLLKKLAEIDGVIQMVEWIETRDSYIIVMERPERVMDMFQYIQEFGSLDEIKAKRFFRQIVEAVRDVTKRGVVHRDLKTENLLVDLANDQAKLIDFGCGAHLRDTAYRYHGGTHLCNPHEWFRRHNYQDREAAVWSLGLILFHMVCGDIPFENTNQVIKVDIDKEFKECNNTASNELQDLVKQCLCKYPPMRPTVEQILEHPWLNEALIT